MASKEPVEKRPQEDTLQANGCFFQQYLVPAMIASPLVRANVEAIFTALFADIDGEITFTTHSPLDRGHMFSIGHKARFAGAKGVVGKLAKNKADRQSEN